MTLLRSRPCCLRFGALGVGRWDGVLVRGASRRLLILSLRWSRARTRSRCCLPTKVSAGSLCMHSSTGASGPSPAGWASRWRSRISPCFMPPMRSTPRRLGRRSWTQSPGHRRPQHIAACAASTKPRRWRAARLGRWECVRRSCCGAWARQRNQAPAGNHVWQVLVSKAALPLADVGSCSWTTSSPPEPRCGRQRLR